MVSSAIFGFLLHQVIKHPHWLGLFEKWNAIQAENSLLNIGFQSRKSKEAVGTMYLYMKTYQLISWKEPAVGVLQGWKYTSMWVL